jgi:sterol desaturase/sphingolipid hydroxylase (fatty acid hydroxylase superfamily)
MRDTSVPVAMTTLARAFDDVAGVRAVDARTGTVAYRFIDDSPRRATAGRSRDLDQRRMVRRPVSTHRCGDTGRMRRSTSSFDEKLEWAAFAIFVVTMIGEHLVLRRRPARAFDDLDDALPEQLARPGQPVDALVPIGYERRDTAASLAMLVGSVAVGLATERPIGRVDRFVLRHRVSNLGARRHSFLTAMFAWDFLYYWEHRLMHEVRLFWANHVSHHSSRHYNLSTALRQPWSAYLMHVVFLPMPLLGFSPSTIRRAGGFNLLYQYWIHTEAIDRLPAPVEAVFNTPSHHRVHHGVNPQYLDRNYGGILIVWDRLFGTFEPELRRVQYGLTTNIETHNPLRIAYHEFAAIGRDVRSARGLRAKLGHVFGRPGWQPTPAGTHSPALASA